MLAHREGDGRAEVHVHEADLFFIVDGEATLVTGGQVVNPTTEKPGEIRGSSIEGGKRQKLSPGDVVHIAANVPHQLLLEPGKQINYFAMKVQGQ
jgi:quercetin dioxygenase-like cupin family protein